MTPETNQACLICFRFAVGATVRCISAGAARILVAMNEKPSVRERIASTAGGFLLLLVLAAVAAAPQGQITR